jgi:hypothetical protein
LLTALALAVDPPRANPLDAELDRISIAWLTFAVLATAAAYGFHLLNRLPFSASRRATAGLALAILAACIWLATFPAILSGPEGILNGPRTGAFVGIAEMQPIRSFADMALYLLIGLFGMTVAAALAISRRSWLFAYAAAAIVALLALAVLHRRFATYQACAGAAALPVAVTLISRRLANSRPQWAPLARLSLLLLVYTAPLVAWRFASTAEADPVSTVTSTCSMAQAAILLGPYDGQVVLADVNMTPALLYWTNVRTVGSLYHRGAQGYLALRAAWRSTDTQHVPPAIAATGASLVLFCHGAKRNFMVGDVPLDTLWDQLARDEPPHWLHQIGSAPNPGFILYRIVIGP